MHSNVNRLANKYIYANEFLLISTVAGADDNWQHAVPAGCS